MTRPTSVPLLCCCALLALLPACRDEAQAGSDPAAEGSERAGDVREDPRLRDAREALESGFTDAAWTLLEQVGDGGVGVGALRARAALMEGDAVGALRELERVRPDVETPEDERAEFLATEIEILAALDRLEGARELLREAFVALGEYPCLERARGVFLLRTPGAGREALAALEAAGAADPDLGFLGFPLAQARLLVGRELLSEDPDRALELARAAVAFDPANAEFRELAAEALSATMRFEEALEIYAALEEEGGKFRDTRALLHQKLATRHLLEGDRDAAVVQYAEARALGLDDEGLGFGVEVLREKTHAWIDAGIDAFDKGRYELAAESFEEALRLSPKDLEARNHLGVVRFQLEDYAGAARAWERVLRQASRASEPLPDPVHLNLARAWRLANEPAKARTVLSDYLDTNPEGTWAEATRELLELLELEELR